MGLDIYFKTKQRDRLIDKMGEGELRGQLMDALYVMGHPDKWDCEKYYRIVSDKLGQEEQDVGYLRKVNYVYGYFKDRVDNNCECEIEKEDLQDLIERCKKVLAEHDQEVSEELLPTCDGFFFGSLAYDEYYYSDVKEGLDLFTKLLNDYDNSKVLYVWFYY
jgi:hypothetical protein